MLDVEPARSPDGDNWLADLRCAAMARPGAELAGRHVAAMLAESRALHAAEVVDNVVPFARRGAGRGRHVAAAAAVAGVVTVGGIGLAAAANELPAPLQRPRPPRRSPSA
jgi:hypothetical protein